MEEARHLVLKKGVSDKVLVEKYGFKCIDSGLLEKETSSGIIHIRDEEIYCEEYEGSVVSQPLVTIYDLTKDGLVETENC